MKKRVIIIGGGAAGSMAALTAAQNGADVLLLEQNEIIGRKILSTVMADVTLPIVFRIHPAIEATIADLHGNQSENFLSLRQRLFLKILEFIRRIKMAICIPGPSKPRQ